MPSPEPEISVVVANYNGRAYIADALTTLQVSAHAAGRPCEMIVVDDASPDRSHEIVARDFPDVQLLRNESNQGFARSCNRGARQARGRVLVMMNNDITVPPDFLERLCAPFFDPPEPDSAPLFAVAAKCVDFDQGAPNQLCISAAWRRGGIGKVWADPDRPAPTTFAQGGAAAYDRERFLGLGGFDPVFEPGYWEDYDLSYRACRAGWRVLYQPAAIARHVGGASMQSVLGARRRARIIERNRLWFNWLNLDEPALLARHILAIPWVCLRDPLQGNGSLGLAGALLAIERLGDILRHRRMRKKQDPPARLGDRQLLRPAPGVAWREYANQAVGMPEDGGLLRRIRRRP